MMKTSWIADIAIELVVTKDLNFGSVVTKSWSKSSTEINDSVVPVSLEFY